MAVISGRSLLIQLLLVLLILASFSEVSHGKGSDPVLSTSGSYIHFPDVDIPLPDFVPDIPPKNLGIPWLPSIGVSPSPPPPRQSPPPPSPSPPPPRQSPPPPSPPPPQQSPPPPPPSTDSFVIPPFLVGPIDPTKIIPPLIPGFPSITNPTPSSQLSPPVIKSPSQCKPSPPDQSAKQSPPPSPKQPPPPRAPSPSPSPAKQPPPPPPRAPSPSPARQPTPPPVKAPPPPSKKSPPPAPPPSIANQPVMAPSPSPAVIITPFPSSPVAKPPLVPRRPVKPILPPAKTLTVNGLVLCKPCKSYGVPTLLNASPLQGASVKLVCYNGKNAIVQSAITDNNGEFRVTPKSLIGADIGKCKVYLVKSPNPTCNVPTNFNGGKTGALLLQHIIAPKPPTVTPAVVVPVRPPATDLYGVGPFIFEASSKMPCTMRKK